jgi:hypothetical protein
MTYNLVSQENFGGDQWFDMGSMSPSGIATVEGGVFSNGTAGPWTWSMYASKCSTTTASVCDQGFAAVNFLSTIGVPLVSPVQPMNNGTFVSSLYYALLGQPDANGWLLYKNLLDDRADPIPNANPPVPAFRKDDVVTAILASSAYRNHCVGASNAAGSVIDATIFVTCLYMDALGGLPTDGGVHYWAANVAPYGAAAVLYQFITSAPFAQLHGADIAYHVGNISVTQDNSPPPNVTLPAGATLLHYRDIYGPQDISADSVQFDSTCEVSWTAAVNASNVLTSSSITPPQSGADCTLGANSQLVVTSAGLDLILPLTFQGNPLTFTTGAMDRESLLMSTRSLSRLAYQDTTPAFSITDNGVAMVVGHATCLNLDCTTATCNTTDAAVTAYPTNATITGHDLTVVAGEYIAGLNVAVNCTVTDPTTGNYYTHWNGFVYDAPPTISSITHFNGGSPSFVQGEGPLVPVKILGSNFGKSGNAANISISGTGVSVGGNGGNPVTNWSAGEIDVYFTFSPTAVGPYTVTVSASVGDYGLTFDGVISGQNSGSKTINVNSTQCAPSIAAGGVQVNGQVGNTVLLAGSAGYISLYGTCFTNVSSVGLPPGFTATSFGIYGNGTQINVFYTSQASAPPGQQNVTVAAQQGTASAAVTVVSLTVSPSLWFFGTGNTVNGYSTQAVATMNGASGGSFAWAVTAGTDKVSFLSSEVASSAATPANSITVYSIGFSQSLNDVTISGTWSPGTGAAPVSLSVTTSVDSPYELGLVAVTPPTAVSACDGTPGNLGWRSTYMYSMVSFFGAPLPGMSLNEAFANIADAQPNNWSFTPNGSPGIPTVSRFIDTYCLANQIAAKPPSMPPQSPLGTSLVDSATQYYSLGSATIGSGVPVQTQQLFRYLDHAIVGNIITPVR